MIRWGIIGTGNIAQRFIRSLEQSKKGKLIAIASSKEETRKRFSTIKKYENYEDLLRDSEIDAVYIGLPHRFHAEWSIKALQHKKAVLCEKPAALTVKEMQQVIETAKQEDTFYMEAMKTCFTPAFKALVKCINEGVIGKLQHIDVNFCSDGAFKGKVPPTSYLFEAGQGGALNDVSSYLIAFVLSFYSGLPQKITALSQMEKGIDVRTTAELIFEGERKATLEVAINKERERTAVLIGEKGKIIVPVFNRMTEFTLVSEQETKTVNSQLQVDDFFDQIEEVHDCLIQGKKESSQLPLLQILREIQVLEAIRKAAMQV